MKIVNIDLITLVKYDIIMIFEHKTTYTFLNIVA